MNAELHFQHLSRDLVAEFGELSEFSISSVVGFLAGGPVSLDRVEGRSVYVTCELSLCDGQISSSEGFKFELMYRDEDNVDNVRQLLTALGSLSFNAELGDGHTIDVSRVTYAGGPNLLRLKLYSQCAYLSGRYGVYEVLPG